MSQNNSFHTSELFLSVQKNIEAFNENTNNRHKEKTYELMFGVLSAGFSSGITSLKIMSSDEDPDLVLVYFTFDTTENTAHTAFVRIDNRPAINAMHQAMLDSVQLSARMDEYDRLKLMEEALKTQYEYDKANLGDKIARCKDAIESLRARVGAAKTM